MLPRVSAIWKINPIARPPETQSQGEISTPSFLSLFRKSLGVRLRLRKKNNKKGSQPILPHGEGIFSPLLYQGSVSGLCFSNTAADVMIMGGGCLGAKGVYPNKNFSPKSGLFQFPSLFFP